MKTTPSATAIAGRPRDRRIDEAIIAATRELLVSQGYSGLSLTAVAANAGTSTPALYRRWPTKAHLVHEAAFPVDPGAKLTSSGDLRSDLLALVAGGAALFSDPVVRAALPGLIGDLSQHPELHEQLMSRLWGSQIDAVQELLDHAAEQGLAKPGVQARHLLSLIGGTALLSVVTPSAAELDASWVEAITEIVLEGIAP
ncbi:MAG TPA: TetR/AcrR family transcriptional regulator [Nocardioidaceae bacterium]|nr:TetR/AcrR family transcriptional regulator [Nocardioidaceae bacterium]